MKKRICFLLAVLCLLAFACQPTPEVEPVPNKGDFTLEQQIEEARKTPAPQSSAQASESESTAAPEPQPIIIPDRWEDKIESGGWSIPIDAEIVAEQKDSYPVYIVHPKTFTEEEINQIAKAYFGDRITGICSDPNGLKYTEEECKRALQQAVDMNREDDDWFMEHLMQCMENAAERTFIPAEHIDSELNENGEYIVLVQYIGIDGSEEIGAICVSGDRYEIFKYPSGVEQADEARTDGIIGLEPMNLHADIALSEAIEIAEDFLQRAGIEGFVYTNAVESVLCSGFYSEIYNVGWRLEFNNPFGYASYQSSKRGGNGPFQFDSVQVSYPWGDFYNYIKIYVSKDGVQDFWWAGPLDATEKVDGLSILPVEEAEGIIKRLLTYGLPQHNGDYAMKVSKLLLGSAMQPMKDNQDLVYLVPAWVCEIEIYGVNQRTGVKDETPKDTLYYTFSAVDGTYLDWRP